MEIKTTVDGTKACLEVEGKLTVNTSPELSEAVEQLPEDIETLDLDLTNVDYIASAGLRVLVATEKLFMKRGGSMRLLHPIDDVMEVFDMTGLSDVFTIER